MLVAGAWYWAWPNRDIGAFIVETEAKRRHAAAVLEDLMPERAGTSPVVLRPDRDDARLAYQLDRVRVGELVSFFVCGDGCPRWRPGDPVTASRDRSFERPPPNCQAWLEAAGLTVELRPQSPERDLGPDCLFRGRHRGASIELEATTVEWSGTGSLSVTVSVP